ncbi:MAG: sensor histidine kinase [Nonomuraea sp.]|nr:sensor histidine kinase [Nonomuraea sp.]
MRQKSLYSPYLALIVAVAQVVMSEGAYWGQKSFRNPLDPTAYALLLIGPLMLLIHRKWPVPALGVTFAATFAFMWGGYPYGPIFFSPGIILFSMVTRGRRLVAWIGAGVMLAFFIAYAYAIGEQGAFHNLSISAFMLLFMMIAELSRIVVERRAERLRIAEEEARRQASEERLTMAQELHDVLAHNISLIHVQASTALHLMDDHPEQARTALATIKTASKEVLGEMRSVLNVLREGAPRSPTAGLDRLDELVERSGMDVTLKRVGSRPLPPTVERAAYRIVQESLTNAARHAPGSQVTIRLEYGAAELAVLVTDTGATRPAVLSGEGSGNGIPGMRERASALGGSLVAGPVDGGFQVEARLPLPAASDEETS